MKKSRRSTPHHYFCIISTLLLMVFLRPDSLCDDVTSAVRINMGAMRYNRSTGIVTYEVSLTNISATAIPTHIFAVVDNISSPGVTVANADGTIDSKPYFDYFESVGEGQLDPGATSEAKTWAFHNPTRLRFSLSVRILSKAPRVIEFPRANPDTILLGEVTTVTVTVQMGADVELLPEQIHVLRLDDGGVVQENLGRMYDDATHGDLLHGDGTFTCECQLHGAVDGQIHLVIQAFYSGPPTPAYSDVLTVDVVVLPPAELVDDILLTNAQASQHFQDLADQVGPDQARGLVLTWLQINPIVQHAFVSGDGTTICVTYSGGLEGGILAGPQGFKSVPQNSTGIAASHPEFNNAATIASTLNDNTCVDCTTSLGNTYTLDQVKDFDNKGVIYLDTHGCVYGENPNTSPIAIMTGETTFSFVQIPTSHLYDWSRRRIVVLGWFGTNYIFFKPSFIRAHCASFPNSLVVASACHSYENLTNTTMADAFLDGGCAAYVGWSDRVSVSFANGAGGIDNTFFTRLADGDSVQEAFAKWTLAQRTDPSTGAIYGYVGDGDLELPKELVENGNFETGDLSGWTTGFTEGGDFPEYGCPGGYWTVTGERKTEGSYSARLGKFDQPYVYGLYGEPMPGNQPAGREWMYQDVDLPAGSTKTLTFSWMMRTFDTALWDWFDARIMDPSTGAVLAIIVSQGGKPGADYGVYWENDWSEVSYDLSAFQGQTIRIRFDCRCNGWGDQTAVYIDKVTISCEE